MVELDMISMHKHMWGSISRLIRDEEDAAKPILHAGLDFADAVATSMITD